MSFSNVRGFGGFFQRSPNVDEIQEPKQDVLFDTQAKILKDVDAFSRDGVSGICSPLSNLFAKARMEGKDPEFLTESSSKKIYNGSLKLLNGQMKLDKNGVDGFHIAFKDRVYSIFNIFKSAGIHYGKTSDKKGPTEEKSLLSENADYDKILGKHNLITYPTGERGTGSHQIYFGRDTDKECRIFDANEKGGVTKGLCSDLIKRITEVSQKCLRSDGLNKVEIAASDGVKKG